MAGSIRFGGETRLEDGLFEHMFDIEHARAKNK
jgi:hypothetical protein